MVTVETGNIYLTVFGAINLGSLPYLLIKLYMAVRDYDNLADDYIITLDIIQKKDALIGQLQSKRDKHKQELASWKKQKYNLQQRIKELEGE